MTTESDVQGQGSIAGAFKKPDQRPRYVLTTPEQVDAFFTAATLAQHDWLKIGHCVERGVGGCISFKMYLDGQPRNAAGRYGVYMRGPALEHAIRRFEAPMAALTLSNGSPYTMATMEAALARLLPELKEGLGMARTFCTRPSDWHVPPKRNWVTRLIYG